MEVVICEFRGVFNCGTESQFLEGKAVNVTGIGLRGSLACEGDTAKVLY